MPKTYILYNARFFKIFKSDCNNVIVPTYCDKQTDAMWYNENSRELFDTAVAKICAHEEITVDKLEFLTL